MQETKDKSDWIKPDLHILTFKETATGFLEDPNMEDGIYTATQPSA